MSDIDEKKPTATSKCGSTQNNTGKLVELKRKRSQNFLPIQELPITSLSRTYNPVTNEEHESKSIESTPLTAEGGTNPQEDMSLYDYSKHKRMMLGAGSNMNIQSQTNLAR